MSVVAIPRLQCSRVLKNAESSWHVPARFPGLELQCSRVLKNAERARGGLTAQVRRWLQCSRVLKNAERNSAMRSSPSASVALQCSRVLKNAESICVRSSSPQAGWLQCSRVLKNAERLIWLVTHAPHHPASMQPRSEERGELYFRGFRRQFFQASMQPRSEERGEEVKAPDLNPTSPRLQCSRVLKNAESNDAGSRGARRRASFNAAAF